MELLAFGQFNNPIYVWSVVMLSGFALIYAQEKAIRLAGVGLMFASLLMTTPDRESDAEGFFLFLILIAIFFAFRPAWWKRS